MVVEKFLGRLLSLHLPSLWLRLPEPLREGSCSRSKYGAVLGISAAAFGTFLALFCHFIRQHDTK